MLRIDENYDDKQQLQLGKKLGAMEMSIPRALANLLELSYEIASEDSKEAK